MRRILVLLVLVSCADVPTNPSYFEDVLPILRGNCASCHGADPVLPSVAKNPV